MKIMHRTILPALALIFVLACACRPAHADLIIPVTDDYHATMNWSWYYSTPGFTPTSYEESHTYTKIPAFYRFRDYPIESRYFGSTTRGFLAFMWAGVIDTSKIKTVTLNFLPVQIATDGLEIWHVSDDWSGANEFDRLDKASDPLLASCGTPANKNWISIDLTAGGGLNLAEAFASDDNLLILALSNVNEFADVTTFSGPADEGLWKQDKFSLGSIDRPGDDIAYLQVSFVPVPAAVWLLGSGLIGLFGLRKRLK